MLNSATKPVQEQTIQIILISAEPQDAEILTAICKRAFHSDITCGAPSEGGPPGYDSPQWQRAAMDKATAYLKILVDGQIAGGAIVFARRDGSYYLGRIFLDPRYYRQGIGSQAMQMIFAQFPAARKWRLETPPWNTRTRRFYQKLGFRLVKETATDLFFEKEMSS